MKKAQFKIIYTAAAVLTVTMACTMFAYGTDIIKTIKEYQVGDHAKYFVTVMDEDANIPLPSELQGLLFDAEGNLLTEYPKDGEMYFENGNRAAVIASNDSNVSEDGKTTWTKLIAVPAEEAEAMRKKMEKEREETRFTFFESLEDAKPYLAFDFLTPKSLPEGFSIGRVYAYNDETGKLPPKEETKYLSYDIVNGDRSIYVQLRLMDDETAFESSATENMQKITIAGYPGVLDGNNLDVEIDGVMYMFMGNRSGITQEELLTMAASLIDF